MSFNKWPNCDLQRQCLCGAKSVLHKKQMTQLWPTAPMSVWSRISPPQETNDPTVTYSANVCVEQNQSSTRNKWPNCDLQRQCLCGAESVLHKKQMTQLWPTAPISVWSWISPPQETNDPTVTYSANICVELNQSSTRNKWPNCDLQRQYLCGAESIPPPPLPPPPPPPPVPERYVEINATPHSGTRFPAPFHITSKGVN